MLAVLLAAPPQDTVVDRPVFTDAAYGVSVPRPGDDWVFVPATERGTTTVIFHPRGAALSDQLWGALVLTRWGGPIPLGEVADARVSNTWRPTYGRSFTLLARDSLDLAGFPAIHLIMGGSIEGAVVDVEEYLIARDTDLVLLQFRLPRGEPRDTVAEGYQHVISGLDLGGSLRVATPVQWRAAAEGGPIVVELPESLMAVAPGTLTSQVMSGGRRLVRWTQDAPGQPDSLVVVGRYVREERRIGRLTVTVWRLPADKAGAARMTDDGVAAAVEGWSRYWLAFGPVPRADLTLVETGRPATRGATGIVFVGRDATAGVMLRELARTWWGGYVQPDSAAPVFVTDWLPQWSAWLVLAGTSEDGDPMRDAWNRARAMLGEARLRECLRTLAAAGRDGASSSLFLSCLDERTSTALRASLP